MKLEATTYGERAGTGHLTSAAELVEDHGHFLHLSQGGVIAYYSGCLTHSSNKLYFQLLIVLPNFTHSG